MTSLRTENAKLKKELENRGGEGLEVIKGQLEGLVTEMKSGAGQGFTPEQFA